MECALLNDPRPIHALWYAVTDLGDANYVVGSHGVTSICVIPVAGEGAYVPWFEVAREGNSPVRVNGRYVVDVTYAEV